MKCRYEIKVFNAGLVIAVYLLLGMYSCARAQALQRICEAGYEVAFGAHNFMPRGTSEQKTKLSAGSRGITLGGFFGNNLVKTRFRGLGYYESNRVFGQNFYQFEAELLANFYPLEFVRVNKNILDVYLLTGVNFTHINFDKNFSPYKLQQFNRWSRVAGLGAEYLLRKGGKTICLFSEVTLGSNLNTKPDAHRYNGPLPSVLSAVNAGARVSYRKAVKIKRGF